MRVFQSILVGAAVLVVSACGSTPAPRTEIALAETALQGAIAADAQTHAPILLRTAREKQALASEAMSKERYGAARRLSEQATVDAELAKARTESEKSRLALKEVQDSIQLMRQEVGRANNQ